jgi:hypothetical protein
MYLHGSTQVIGAVANAGQQMDAGTDTIRARRTPHPQTANASTQEGHMPQPTQSCLSKSLALKRATHKPKNTKNRRCRAPAECITPTRTCNRCMRPLRRAAPDPLPPIDPAASTRHHDRRKLWKACRRECVQARQHRCESSMSTAKWPHTWKCAHNPKVLPWGKWWQRRPIPCARINTANAKIKLMPQSAPFIRTLKFAEGLSAASKHPFPASPTREAAQDETLVFELRTTTAGVASQRRAARGEITLQADSGDGVADRQGQATCRRQTTQTFRSCGPSLSITSPLAYRPTLWVGPHMRQRFVGCAEDRAMPNAFLRQSSPISNR